MNQRTKHLMCLTALVSAVNLLGDGTTSKIVPRSQSFNAARQIVGWNNVDWGIHRKPQGDESYSSFNMIFEYTRTFRGNRLAKALFGDDLICTGCDESSIQIMGSAVANRPETAWLAENFGLPTDFQSTVNFSPRITNYILEFSYYAGLDAWVKGSYFKIYAPFVHTAWNLNAKECNITQGTTGYFQGYFSSAAVPATQLNSSFLSYANGCTPFINNDYDLNYQSTVCYDNPDYPCTPLADITWNPLCCTKISPECCCEGVGLSRNGFGEIRFILGYDFLNDEAGDYHMGLGAYVAAPTGSRIGSVDCDGNGKGRYLFEPIIGNGKHWEFGGQMTAHSVWWSNEENTKSLTFYLEANVTHLFKACQTRCFDLCSAGSNSRYMIAERLQSNRNTFPGLNITTFNTAQANNSDTLAVDSLGLEFGNEYAPVANITRRNVTSTIGAQGDVAFTLSYKSNSFQWDIGYNFWGRTCEKLEIKDGCCNSNQTLWALKGDQRVYGFTSNYPEPGNFLAVSIPATDSKATIHRGSNLANNVSPLSSSVNFYADNSTRLNDSSANEISFNDTITTLPAGTSAIYTSEQPVMINEADFNLNGTRGISNKIFTHFNYAWPDMKDGKWSPYVGLGLEVECGGGGSNCCDTDCDTSCNTTCNPCATPCDTYPSCKSTPCSIIESCCSNIALSQWGIWFKIGTSYN